jgi:hypothetical protein
MNSPVSAIEAIEKAMEGVTPGPWKAVSDPHFDSGLVYTSVQPINIDEEAMKPLAMANGEYHVCRMSHTAAPWRFNYHRANARYIAACNPVAMREVLAIARKAEALEREVDSLKQTRQHSREASAALHDAFMAERKRVEALQRENAELREVGDTLAAQTRSYQRGFSGTLPLGQALNNWDKASARALLGGENAE